MFTDDNDFSGMVPHASAASYVPVPPAIIEEEFRIDARLLSTASAYIRLSHVREALESALSEWVRELAHHDAKRRAAIRIAIENDLPLGDKGMDRGLHAGWNADMWEQLGPPPHPRTVRRWVSAVRDGRRIPTRDYVRGEKPGAGSARKETAKTGETARPDAADPKGEGVATDSADASRGDASTTRRSSCGPKAAVERWHRAMTGAAGGTDAVLGDLGPSASLRLEFGDPETPRTTCDEVPIAPENGSRATSIVEPAVGDVVEVGGVGLRRYLGRTLEGGHAFAERREEMINGAKPKVETLRGEFAADRFLVV